MYSVSEENFLKRIEAGEKIGAHDDMPEEYRRVIIKHLECQADAELSGAYSIIEWIAKAPTIQEKMIVAQIIKDEIRHAGVFYHCLKELGVDVESRVQALDQFFNLIYTKGGVSPKGSQKQLNVYCFRIETWSELIMCNFCLDRHAAHALTEFGKASYHPLAKACQNVLKEEAMHIAHGDLWVKELAMNPETRAEVQQALDKWFPKVIDEYLGSCDAQVYKIYKKWRIIDRSGYEIREGFRKEIEEKVIAAGLQMPAWTPIENKKINTPENQFLPKIKRKILTLLPH